MTRPVGRVLVAVCNGVPEFEDFTPKRIWFWSAESTDRSWWPIRFWTGGDEACNPTLAVTTWLGTMIVAYRWRLNSSTPPDALADMLTATPPLR